MERIKIKELAREVAEQVKLHPEQREEILAEVLRRVAVAAFHSGFSHACWVGQVDVYADPEPAKFIDDNE